MTDHEINTWKREITRRESNQKWIDLRDLVLYTVKIGIVVGLLAATLASFAS
jgi:hypothetical protein